MVGQARGQLQSEWNSFKSSITVPIALPFLMIIYHLLKIKTKTVQLFGCRLIDINYIVWKVVLFL
jgi:hypothetical protein